MALLEDVKKSLQSGFQLPQFGQSEQVRQLQRAATGRLAAETGPTTVSLAEQVAASAAEQQRQEDVLAGKVQAEQLTMQEKAQQEQFRQQNVELDEKALNARLDLQNKTSNLLQDYSQRSGEIEMRQESAKTQYLTTLMRLSNDDYLDRLETEAAASRLQDQSAFEWELAQSIFDEEVSLLKSDLAFRSALAADDRIFKEYLNEMELSTALELSSLEILSSETLSKYEAYGQGASAAVRVGGEIIGQALSDESEPGGGGTKTGFGGPSTRPGSRMTYGG